MPLAAITSGCLALVLAPVGRLTVPLMLVIFQVPDWVAGCGVVPVGSMRSGAPEVPTSVPAALRRLVKRARLAVTWSMPCWPVVRALFVAVVWKKPPDPAKSEAPAVKEASSAVLTPEPEQLAHWTFKLFEVEAITLPEPSTT